MHIIADPSQGFSFGEAIYSVGGVYGPLRNRYVTLLMMHEGTARVTCDDKIIIVEAGQCGFIANESYLLFEYQKGKVSWCEGYPAQLPDTATLHPRAMPSCIAISEQTETLQRLGVELGLGSSANRNTLRNALGQALFAAFFHEAQMSEQERHVPRSIHRARHYIEENFSKDVTVGHLAEVVALTPQHLISSFRKHIGTTPVRYLWQIRASRGHFLLLQTGLTISEIAYQCGYKNPFHFSRQIRQHFGKPPTELRSNMGYCKRSIDAEQPVDTFY